MSTAPNVASSPNVFSVSEHFAQAPWRGRATAKVIESANAWAPASEGAAARRSTEPAPAN